jgi:uncharacterized membrane protein
VTVGEWLAARTPPPPAPLRAWIEAALGDGLRDDAAQAPERCLAAAEGILAELVAREDARRESALSLLAADALVTYAFEAASGEAARLDVRTRDAMARLAALAPEKDAPAATGR